MYFDANTGNLYLSKRKRQRKRLVSLKQEKGKVIWEKKYPSIHLFHFDTYLPMHRIIFICFLINEYIICLNSTTWCSELLAKIFVFVFWLQVTKATTILNDVWYILNDACWMMHNANVYITNTLCGPQKRTIMLTT